MSHVFRMLNIQRERTFFRGDGRRGAGSRGGAWLEAAADASRRFGCPLAVDAPPLPKRESSARASVWSFRGCCCSGWQGVRARAWLAAVDAGRARASAVLAVDGADERSGDARACSCRPSRAPAGRGCVRAWLAAADAGRARVPFSPLTPERDCDMCADEMWEAVAKGNTVIIP